MLNYQSKIKNKSRRGPAEDKVKCVVKRNRKTSLDKIKYLKMYRKSKIQYTILNLKCKLG